jgi:hypothetical protein
MRFCVYATARRRGPKPEGIIAGSHVDDERPLWVADGLLHGARIGEARTLCGLSIEGLHPFAEQDFESVSISAGGCRDCALAAQQQDK